MPISSSVDPQILVKLSGPVGNLSGGRNRKTCVVEVVW